MIVTEKKITVITLIITGKRKKKRVMALQVTRYFPILQNINFIKLCF